MLIALTFVHWLEIIGLTGLHSLLLHIFLRSLSPYTHVTRRQRIRESILSLVLFSPNLLCTLPLRPIRIRAHSTYKHRITAKQNVLLPKIAANRPNLFCTHELASATTGIKYLALFRVFSYVNCYIIHADFRPQFLMMTKFQLIFSTLSHRHRIQKAVHLGVS